MAGPLTTIRAGKWHVVTASKCGVHCFNSYLIKNCAVISTLWLCGCVGVCVWACGLHQFKEGHISGTLTMIEI